MSDRYSERSDLNKITRYIAFMQFSSQMTIVMEFYSSLSRYTKPFRLFFYSTLE